METITALTIISLVLGAAVSAALARRHAALWESARAIALPAGRRLSPAAGAPALVAVAATLSIALGLMTLVVFAPLGLLLGWLGLASPRVLAMVALIALCINGFGIGTGSLRAAGALYRRDRDLLLMMARRGAVHHAAVLALFVYLDGELAALAAIPCLLGLGLALAYRKIAL